MLMHCNMTFLLHKFRKFPIEHTVFSKDVKGAFDKHQGLFIKSVLHQTLMRRKAFEVFFGGEKAD